MSLILFASFFVLVLIGVPVAFSLGLSSIAALLYQGQIPLIVSVQRLFTGTDSFPLMAIPFFMMAGALMNTGGISRRLVDFASAVVGHKTGGLAYVTAMASMLFAAVSGSGAATTAAIGGMMIPALIKKGYGKEFASALQASSGSLGVVIPPSIPFVLFGFMSGVSIAELFLAGIVPGVLIAVLLMVVSYFMVKNGPSTLEERVPFKEMVRRFFAALPALLMPAIILGGIFSGQFTPTEAAVIAVVYGFIVGIFVYRELNLANIMEAMKDAVISNAVVLMLLAFASTFSWIMASELIPQKIAALMSSIAPNQFIFLLLVTVFLLIIGTFLETTPALILLVPILVPVAQTFDVNLVHFGVLMVVNLAIGMVTPPLGITLFVASNISKVPLANLFRAIVPFILCMIAALLVLTFVPQISLFVPELFSK
ncbi:TRAP transporter large permease [Desulfoscipio geothermicus]|uniref:C4-dicarboxylate transporter, DctM subunit n=1 Tax=Desulfoscipio geothermicus DSM 3669 TaxID=1121426 RepID=A0A1I6DW66_9FIRM|nr:TRAP transporter large permease [Desulfoscipio geothermicus]SFR09676.1 C4-dicarboxylate transporter, DctM subunit [Desulfoscipio geothermicus DSM 3669]